MLSFRKIATGLIVGAGDAGTQYWCQKSTPVPTEFMKKKSDVYELVVTAGALVGSYLLARCSAILDDLAQSALPLLMVTVGPLHRAQPLNIARY